MPRPATVWWNKQRSAWCTDIGGNRHVLAKGKANKKLAKEKLKDLLDEQTLLADVNGAITVAAMCDAFLEDALHNLEKRTYESYVYGCQKFVDAYASRAAHTISPQDISKFARGLKGSLNATSHHRIAAARSLGFQTIDCEVREGTERDALLFALGSNVAHGLRRSNWPLVFSALFAHIVERRVAHAINDGRQLTGLPKLLEASEKRLQMAMKSLKLVRGMKV